MPPTTQNAAVTLAYADTPGFPAGSVVDHVFVMATASNPANSPPPQIVAPGTDSVTFDDLAPDTYQISAQAFPVTGPGFGQSATTSITIAAVGPVTVSLSLPASVSATQP